MSTARACWCGHGVLSDYSSEYRVCYACGTLVSSALITASVTPERNAPDELYGADYWTKRQTEHHRLPDIRQRARLDLPERCTHWLQHLIEHRLPPGRVLEVGCAHGGYLSLLQAAGFSVVGTEMSPVVTAFARDNFGVEVRAGPIEAHGFAPASFDVIVLNDVLEHLPSPLETISHCATLLAPDGFFVLQTPEYKEHLTYADLVANEDLFLRHMRNNNEEHLYLFSRRSVAALFARVGLPHLEFGNPVYSYDMFFTASRQPLTRHSPPVIADALTARPTGRLVLALLDKAFESQDRWWAVQRLEAQIKNAAKPSA